MRKLAITAAIAGTLALAGAGTMLAGGVASAEPIRLAEAGISVRIGDGHRDRNYRRHHDMRPGWRARGCRTVTIKERHGNRVVIKKIRRC